MSLILVFWTFLLIVLSDCPRAAPLNESVVTVMRSKRSNGCEEECGVGNSKDKEPLMLSGEDVHPQNKYPWMVGLIAKEDTTKVHCGGSIVNDRFILTAAHCLATSDQIVEIILADGSRAPVKQVHFEPNYNQNPQPNNYDLGLVELSESIQCSENKRPACLPEHETDRIEQDAGSRMIMIGWGAMNAKSMADFGSVLREFPVTMTDFDECKGNEEYLPYQGYCVTSKGNSSPCFGDAGGSLFSFNETRFYVQGIAAIGTSNDCNPKDPTLFTGVAPFIMWISHILGDLRYQVGRPSAKLQLTGITKIRSVRDN